MLEVLAALCASPNFASEFDDFPQDPANDVDHLVATFN